MSIEYEKLQVTKGGDLRSPALAGNLVPRLVAERLSAFPARTTPTAFTVLSSARARGIFAVTTVSDGRSWVSVGIPPDIRPSRSPPFLFGV
jgi:hypothetical protein